MALVAEHKKMSLTECKKILNTDGMFYTDEEIIELSDFIYHLTDIVLDDLEKEKYMKPAKQIEAHNKDKP